MWLFSDLLPLTEPTCPSAGQAQLGSPVLRQAGTAGVPAPLLSWLAPATHSLMLFLVLKLNSGMSGKGQGRNQVLRAFGLRDVAIDGRDLLSEENCPQHKER